MKRILCLLIAVLFVTAACTKVPATQESPSTPAVTPGGGDDPGEDPGDEPGGGEDPGDEPGGGGDIPPVEPPITIRVTLPEIEPLDSKAALSLNGNGGFNVSWSTGDCILVGDKTFTLVSSEGRTGVFSGPRPEGTLFNIRYPAEYVPNPYLEQKSNGDYSHLPYQVSLMRVDSYEDVVLSYGWAAEHGGTFSQLGCLQLVLNLPETASGVSAISIVGEDVPTTGLRVKDGTLDNHSFTAWIPCAAMDLHLEHTVSIFVTSASGQVFTNTFYPSSRTLPDSHVIKWVTSTEKWIRRLEGEGTATRPYLVTDAADMDNIRNLVKENEFTYFRLTNDIDMSSITTWIPINEFDKPVGVMFDGQNHKISHFSCKNPNLPSMFGILHGEVRDLTLEDSEVSTVVNTPAGTIAAYAGNSGSTLHGRIENVHIVRGLVSESNYGMIGGLCGCSGGGTFVNCSFDGTVKRPYNGSSTSDMHSAGGILGQAYSNVTLQSCSTSGTLTTNSGRGNGGIVGYGSTSLSLTDCHSTMSISARDEQVGGICGTVKGSVTLNQCSYNGTISCNSGVCGGILGQGDATTGMAGSGTTITRCYTSGSISATSYTAGIVGRTNNLGTLIEDCGTTMFVNASANYVGGILGDAPINTTIRRCFASGDIRGSYGIGGIIGRAFGRYGTDKPVSTVLNTTVEDCIAFSSLIKTVTSGGENPSTHYSGGAIIGYTSTTSTLANCWRSADMVLNYFPTASLNTLFDHSNCSQSQPLTQPDGSGKWFCPYHGKAAGSSATVSSLAQSLGWSSTIWNFSSAIPTLK
ncbi:MAG: hypothetical protein IJU13_04615 [Bacteroidales bacterium]|nr:hypothetical protein [Bacteroidales bacterium]